MPHLLSPVVPLQTSETTGILKMKKIYILLSLLIAFSVSAGEHQGTELQGIQDGNPLEADYWIPMQLDNILAIDTPADPMGAPTYTHASNWSCTDDDLVIQTLGNDTRCFESHGGYRLGRTAPGTTNLEIYARDFTQANWVDTNVTAAKNQTGRDAVALSASSLTATAGNGTVLDTFVLGAVDYTFSVDVKRLVGVGDIDITDDNGGTWTTIAVTTDWTQFEITRSQANPVIGFRIVTSGDSIAVDYAQLETGKFATIRVPTSGATASTVSDGGYPHYTAPDNFAEVLAAEESTGTTDVAKLYKISADVGDHFYTGSAVGEYFDGLAIALDVSNKVTEVTTQAIGTVWLLWRPGFAWDDMVAGNFGTIALTNTAASLFYYDSDGDVKSTDGTAASQKIDFNWTKGVILKVAVQWGDIIDHEPKYRVCADLATNQLTSADCGTDINFDGTYAVSGNEFQIGNTPFGPMWTGQVRNKKSIEDLSTLEW